MSTLVTSNIKHSGSASNNVELDSSGNLKFNSGYGSAAVSYGCRAWVNFDGTGTVAIRSSGNVSSITDNGTGNYTVNFATALADANYSVVFGTYYAGYTYSPVADVLSYSTGSVQIDSAYVSATVNHTLFDPVYLNVAIFR